MKKTEEPDILDIEDVAYNLQALSGMLDGLCALSSDSNIHVHLHKSLYMISNLIFENAAIVENIMNHELSHSRSAKDDKEIEV